MKKILITIAIASLAALQPLSGQADSITPSVVNSATINNTGAWGTLDYTAFNKYGTSSEKDYADAPLSYSAPRSSQTGNDKGQWQGLGTSNGIDDGVLWSVGGSAFGTSADLVRGQDVTFKFLFWQSNNGRHDYDQIFAAFDFGQDGKFDTSDTILYQKIATTNDITKADDVSKDQSRYLEYELTVEVPLTMTLSTTWLRLRAHCNHVTFGNITATNWLSGQGETEDYQFRIVDNPVPEPATMLLFGAGLAALGGLRTRRKK